jgi:hypothetical protein
MYIIPRTPSPPPIERRAPGSLSHEEIAEMRKQLLNANVSPLNMLVPARADQIAGKE